MTAGGVLSAKLRPKSDPDGTFSRLLCAVPDQNGRLPLESGLNLAVR